MTIMIFNLHIKQWEKGIVCKMRFALLYYMKHVACKYMYDSVIITECKKKSRSVFTFENILLPSNISLNIFLKMLKLLCHMLSCI